MPAPPNARGFVATSAFWSLGPTDQQRFRSGWWDAYDALAPAGGRASRNEAYALGRAEYFEHFAANAAGRTVVQLIERPLTELKDHPKNKRPFTKETVAAMRGMIERQGLLQPLVVTADGTTLSGHRRRWALEAMGRTTAPCLVVEGDEARSLEVLLASNEGIEAIDPMAESENVATLLALPGWTLDGVADALGKPRGWVARRARLRDLTPALRKRLKERCPIWSIDWIARLAALPRAAQEELAKDQWTLDDIFEERDLIALLSDHMKILGAAAWDLEDAALVPKAGACTACPKTTLSQPGLFDDQEVKLAAQARCLDGVCWTQKRDAHVAAQLAKAKDEHNELLVVDAMAHAAQKPKALQDVNTLRDHQVQVVSGKTKGAIAAAIVGDDGGVKVCHVLREFKGASAAGQAKRDPTRTPKEDKSPAVRLKESKAAIDKRRKGCVVDAVREAIEDEKLAAPSFTTIRELLFFYQVERDYGRDDRAKVEREAKDDLKLARAVWDRMCSDVAHHLKRFSAGNLDFQYEEARWLAPRVGLDVEELEAQAREDVPAPKWWATLPPSTATKPRAKGAKKTKRAGRDPAPVAGTCSKCGCTEAAACDDGAGGGCHWVNKERTLCSSCGPMPVGGGWPKPAKSRAAAKTPKAAKPRKKHKNPWANMTVEQKAERVRKMLAGGPRGQTATG